MAKLVQIVNGVETPLKELNGVTMRFGQMGAGNHIEAPFDAPISNWQGEFSGESTYVFRPYLCDALTYLNGNLVKPEINNIREKGIPLKDGDVLQFVRKGSFEKEEGYNPLTWKNPKTVPVEKTCGYSFVFKE